MVQSLQSVRVRRDLTTEQQQEFYTSCRIFFFLFCETCLGILKETACLEKAVALQSSTLAQKTPWMEEPGRLQSMGSLRVGHN